MNKDDAWIAWLAILILCGADPKGRCPVCLEHHLVGYGHGNRP